VIPRLREQGSWKVIHLRPGGRPIESIASKLGLGASGLSSREKPSLLTQPQLLSLELQEKARREDSKVLLFVDQLEELFTLVSDEEVRRRFMEAVCTAADDPDGPVRVVFTLREDFLGKAAETEVARAALSRIVVLRSPAADALLEIVTRPLDLQGYSYDDTDLPSEMVEAVRGEAACLPMLQFACNRLWELRDEEEKTLTRSAYEAMGRVEGALAVHADDVLDGMTASQLVTARRVLLRLVTPEGTRRVVVRARLLENLGDHGDEVLDRLIAGRTVHARRGEDTEAELELVHESLITRWARLARWVDESRDEVAFLAEVEQAAELWQQRGCHDEEVWTGLALGEALARASRCSVLPELVRRFLEAGERRETQRVWRKRVFLISMLAALSCIALVLAFLTLEAMGQSRRAEQQEAETRAEWMRAEKGRAEALREGVRSAMARGDMHSAWAKLRASLEIEDSSIARTMWWRLTRDPLLWTKGF